MGATFEAGEMVLVNTLGHAAGVLIFGIFLYLVLRERSASRMRIGRPSLLAAILALLWNAASLAVLVMGAQGTMMERALAAFGFSVLSVLPAVLLRLCLLDRFGLIVYAGYGLSAFAVAAHLLEFAWDAVWYHRLGLSVITIGFGILTAVAVLRVLWSREGKPRSLTSRILAVMSLFLFAMSFVHFGEGHTYEAWSAELAVHHAGIPLALFILLHDFRFVLLDAFIRFLANGVLAGLFGLAIAAAISGMGFVAQALTAALLLGVFAVVRGVVQNGLSLIVFRQPDLQTAERTLEALRSRSAGEEEYLRRALEEIARLLKAPLVTLASSSSRSQEVVFPTPAAMAPEFRDAQGDVRAVVPIRLSHGDVRYALFGERRGGQPYLSEDLKVLARLAACISEHVERIRDAEAQRLVSQAELRALQSQIHPHFLFNALNTLYGLIPREASRARRLLLNLSDIFRYLLQSETAFVPLEEEIRIVESYLAIEKARLGEKLQTDVAVDGTALRELIPVLSIQPLVENAVKHGAAARPQGGGVRIEVTREERGLRISVRDTGPGFQRERSPEALAGAGVGLENVSRRLGLCYGPEAAISIDSSPNGTCVSFFAPRERVAGVPA